VLLQELKLFEYHQISSGLKTLRILDFQELCKDDKQVGRMRHLIAWLYLLVFLVQEILALVHHNFYTEVEMSFS
jgi:hypothetical protein